MDKNLFTSECRTGGRRENGKREEREAMEGARTEGRGGEKVMKDGDSTCYTYCGNRAQLCILTQRQCDRHSTVMQGDCDTA